MTALLAIDPGLSGAWAFFDDGHLISAGDIPRLGDGSQSRVSSAMFASLIKEYSPDVAIIEDVAAMPGQGVSSMFRFGRACGAVEGILAALGVSQQRVTPGKWKGHFRLTGKSDGGAEASRQRAIELWPRFAVHVFARKKDHNRAEAALIGLWYIETQHFRAVPGGDSVGALKANVPA